MAQDMRPWLANAIARHDKEHGKNFYVVSMGRPCQLVKFLTFRTKGDPHAQVTGEICDQTHWVRVRFDVAATDKFENPGHGLPKQSLTSNQRSTFHILQYRLAFLPAHERQKSPWADERSRSKSRSIASGSGSTSDANLSIGVKSQLPMIVFDILKWETACGSPSEAVYFENLSEPGMGTYDVDVRVQKILMGWLTGEAGESQEKEMEDPDNASEEEAAPSRSAKGKAKAADNQLSPEITIRKYTRPSVIDAIITGTTTKALPDWMFDVPADQRETLDSITMFGQDAEKLYQEEQAEHRARAQSGLGESETDDERELAAQSSTRPVIPSPNRRLPTPRRTPTPEPLPQTTPEQDNRPRLGGFLRKPSTAKPTPSPIPSSPPIQQKASSPTSPETVDVHIRPIPPSPESSIPDSPGSPNVPGNPQHTLPLPTPGQRFQSSVAASGLQAATSQPRSSIPLPTPGQGSPEDPYTNPDSVRLTGTQNPLSLPPANQHERRRRQRQRQREGREDDDSSSGSEEEEMPEQSVRSVHIDAKYDKSGVVVKSEAASSSPIQEEEEVSEKVEKKVHMMRRSRPSLDAMFEQSDGDDDEDDDDDDGEMGRIGAKARRHNLDESSEGEEEDVEMDEGGGDTEEEKETDADELSDWENLQREKSRESIKTSSTSRQRPVGSAPGHHQRDQSSSPVGNETIQGDHRRVRMDPAPLTKGKGKVKIEASTSTCSTAHIRQSQSQSQPRSKSQSGSKSQTQSQSQSQSHTQTTQPISSAEEAQRIRPGQHLLVSPYPTTRTYSERLRTPSESLSPSQGSNDLRKFYLRRDGVKEEGEEMMDGDEEEGEEMMDGEGDEGEDEEGEEEEEEESGETPDKSLNRPITKRVRGKQAVVESVDSGHLASSGETVASGSSGRVLVEDSEESLERPGGVQDKRVKARVEATISTTSKKRKNGVDVDSSPAAQSRASGSKRVKSGQTSSPVGTSQDTPAAPKRSARSFLDKINPLNMLREWTTRSQEPILGDEGEEEEEEEEVEVEGEEEDVKMVEAEEEEEEEEEMEEMEELSLSKKDGSSSKVQSGSGRVKVEPIISPPARPQASTNGDSNRQAPPAQTSNPRPSSSSRNAPTGPAARPQPKALPPHSTAPGPSRQARPVSPAPTSTEAPSAKSRTSSIAPRTAPSSAPAPAPVPARVASPPRSRKSTLALVDDLRVPSPAPNTVSQLHPRVAGGDSSKRREREEAASLTRSSMGGVGGQHSASVSKASHRSGEGDDRARVKKEDQPRVKTEETERPERGASSIESHRSAVRPASAGIPTMRRGRLSSADVKPDISARGSGIVVRDPSRQAERENRGLAAVKAETAEVKREGIDPVKKLRGFKLDLNVDGLEEEWVREKMAEGLQERERVRRAQAARDARWASKVQV